MTISDAALPWVLAGGTLIPTLAVYGWWWLLDRRRRSRERRRTAPIVKGPL